MRSLSEGLVDLEELIIACRTEEAREYIREAVGCYKAGAYRSSIVATWIAVVYDVVAKLRDLQLIGDQNAEKKIERFEKIQKNQDVVGSLQFERKVLQIAKDEFALLTEIECDDLKRLQEDRHRCAHPSMMSIGEPYQPTAETARYHLHNAVHHLLQREPVQGKAALDQVIDSIHSQYFPKSEEKARDYFGQSPLAHARYSLVRNVLVVVLKDLLLEESSEDEWDRRVAALKAIRKMYPNIFESTLEKKLSGIVERVEDEYLSRAIKLIRLIPLAWEFVDQHQIRLEEYVKEAAVEIQPDGFSEIVAPPFIGPNLGLIDALQVEPLQEQAAQRLSQLSDDGLATAIEFENDPFLVEESLDRFSDSGSFREAGRFAKQLVQPLIAYLEVEHIRRLLSNFCENKQIGESWEVAPVYLELFENHQDKAPELAGEWEKVYEQIKANGTDHWNELRAALETEFPDWKDETEKEDTEFDEELPF